MTPEAIVRATCQTIWTDGEVDRIGEFYSADFEADYPFTDWGEGLEGARKLAATLRVGFPDYREQIEELWVDGDTVIVKLRIRGTHTGPMPGLPAPTGRKVDFRDVTICEVREGRIARQSGLSDQLTLMLQLGIRELSGDSQP